MAVKLVSWRQTFQEALDSELKTSILDFKKDYRT